MRSLTELLSPKAAREAAQKKLDLPRKPKLSERALALLAEAREWDEAAHQRCCN